MSEHQHYYSDILGALYCRVDGEPWPCLTARQEWEAEKARAVVCKCSHVEQLHEAGGGFCSSVVCGCKRLRPKDVAA